MATVYLAEDLKHHRKVAVKVLRPDLAATMGPAGTPRLLVRFDDPAMPVFGSGSVLAGNGMFYFAVGTLESDIYVMDLEQQ